MGNIKSGYRKIDIDHIYKRCCELRSLDPPLPYGRIAERLDIDKTTLYYIRTKKSKRLQNA